MTRLDVPRPDAVSHNEIELADAEDRRAQEEEEKEPTSIQFWYNLYFMKKWFAKATVTAKVLQPSPTGRRATPDQASEKQLPSW